MRVGTWFWHFFAVTFICYSGFQRRVVPHDGEYDKLANDY